MTTIYDIAQTIISQEDLAEVPIEDRGSVDRIARSLSYLGYGNERVYRTEILRALGIWILGEHNRATDALRFLVGIDPRLAVWGACACARQALVVLEPNEQLSLQCIEMTEQWIAGQVDIAEVRVAKQRSIDRSKNETDTELLRASDAAEYVAVAAEWCWVAETKDRSRYASAVESSVHDAARNTARAFPVDMKRGFRTIQYSQRLERLAVVVADSLPAFPVQRTE